MAGKGQRFVDAGYDVGKPLILVSGEHMVIKAAKTFPKADNWVFVCKKEHIINDQLDSKISKFIPNSKFLPIDYITEGQACTCLLAKNLVNLDESLFIGSCDGSMVWDREKYSELIAEPDTDIVAFAFTRQRNLAMNPKAFGWIKTNGNKIDSVSVKIPLSDNPYNDYAITGFFYFKTANLFFEIVENLVKYNVRINNEFYVDSCINQGIKLGYTAKIFVVDQYIGWGAPEELKEYEFWENYFSH